MIRGSKACSALLLALSLPLAACNDATGPGPNDGTFSLLLTDGPGEFEAAVVTIAEIYLQGDGPSGRVVLLDEPVTTDLVELANDVEALVEDAVVPPGVYGQLRFVVTGAYIEVEDGKGGTETYATSAEYEGLPEGVTPDGTLVTPSLAQTGIKVNLPGGAVVVDGEQKVLVVDFRVSESFGRKAGKSGMWVMHPVVNATELGLTAGIEVSLRLGDGVTLPSGLTLGDFEARLEDAGGNGEGELGLEDDDGDGVFSAVFRYLDPSSGPWSLTFVADGVDFTTDPPTPIEVDAASGETASVSVTVTSASAS